MPADPRGTSAQRGYGKRHKQLRAAWQKRLDAGEVVNCWRCGKRIDPERWHLGHDDRDRTAYRGPECPRCNIGAPHKLVPRKRPAEKHPGLI